MFARIDMDIDYLEAVAFSMCVGYIKGTDAGIFNPQKHNWLYFGLCVALCRPRRLM